MFKKLKDWLGIEGVKVELSVEESLDLSKEEVRGIALLTSQSEQFVEKLHLKLIERYSRGWRKSKLIDEYQIGETEIAVMETVNPDKPVELAFSMHFEYTPSPVEEFGQKNILFKGLSSIARLSKNVKSDFYLLGEVTVKGNALKPYHKLSIQM